MARDIDEIRRDIDQTRSRLRETSEAIGWKADLPARARDVIRETAGVVRERLHHPERRAPERAGEGGESGPGRLSSAKEALAERVGSAKEAVSSATEAAAERAGAAKEAVAERAGSAGASLSAARERAADRLPSAAETRRGVARAASVARGNPVALAAGALVAGIATGLLLPRTELEDERIGPIADDMKERGAELGRETVERGREAAEQAVEHRREVTDAGGGSRPV